VVIRLRPAVRDALVAQGVIPGESDSPSVLKERLNEAYLGEIRALRARQRAGEVPLSSYSQHAEALKNRFALLGLPLGWWTE
jgi:hypothetical protein